MGRVARQNRLRQMGVPILGMFFLAALLAWAKPRIDLDQVLSTLRAADARILATAVPLLLGLNFLLRTARFHALVTGLPLARAGRHRFRDSARSLLISMAVNNVVPLRFGELIRTRDLVSRGYPLRVTVATQLTEKVVELMTLSLWALPLVPAGLLRIPRLPPSYLWPGAAAAMVLAALSLLIWRAGLGAWVCQRFQGWHVKTVFRSAAWSLSADLVELVLIWATLQSLRIASGWKEATAVLVGINLALALPSTPAQLGIFEAGSALALRLL
ncbi:MAG TPA: lysylphosphatidylglycerol synthase transmembrane domain-containing protein, partial [Candidatus Sulfotelmatobacter sp.]|nr:lysylphosphatidylglycerol synthase transmembrane domain-containing protein [Candidatus Sulfotelmatobacter sp.]